ncbi:RNA methyltransferase [Methylophilaceae bacterium]|jgi:RNA methyltransferase, TrmH family|nr:RNA methyltransferase [Methylophilaceae bacterium]
MNEKLIESKNNPFYRKLKKIYSSASFRKNQNQTILDGPHLIQSFFQHSIPEAIIKDSSIVSSEVEHLISNLNCPCYSLSHELFLHLSELKSSTGILALVDIPKIKLSKSNGLILLLDGIQEPGNLGSILRTAKATNTNFIILSKTCADLWSPKTLRGSQGVQFSLECSVEQDLNKWILNYEHDVMALTPGGESLFKKTLNANMAILVGNEGNGISKNLFKNITGTISLPMHKEVESINVGAAASAFMYEYCRQLSIE